MGRKSSTQPLRSDDEQLSRTLQRASSKLVKAKEALDKAREPVREAMNTAKTAGIDGDIFRLFHGIRHNEDDEKRLKRIRMLRACEKALLSDINAPDLFEGDEPALAPEVVQDLRDASDAMHQDEVENGEAGDAADAPFDADTPPAAGEGEQTAEAPEADWGDELLEADDTTLDNAGTVFNAGRDAGRTGAQADANPHEAGSAEHSLWERGRLQGAAQGPEEPAAAAFDPGAKFSGSTEQKRIQAYWHGYRGTEAGCDSATLLAGRRGEIKTQITAGIADFNGKVPPRYADPNAPAVASEPPTVEEGADAAPSAEPTDEGDDDLLVRVEVQDRDGKLVLVDLESLQPLIDVPSDFTGQMWAKRIHDHFAGRLRTVTNSDLKEAAKKLAMGRVLDSTMFPGQPSVTTADLAAAV